MKRLKEIQRIKIIELSKKGVSLNRICKKLSTPKSATYYWFRKINGKKIKELKIDKNLESEIGEIIGAFAGDGSFFKDKNYVYHIRFHLSKLEYQYVQKIKKLLENIYKTRARIYSSESVYIIEITRKVVIEHIKEFLSWYGKRTLTVKLKKAPTNYSLDFLRGFCRGLVDTEGWICKNNLMIASISKDLINDFSASLNILDIPHLKTVWKNKNRKNLRYAIFFNKQNTMIFKERIGFSNMRKIMPPARISEI
ncbi:hypothetical protein A3K64_03875 [Candidatus Micrarchaeota archaeon RBG_16_36_9]|nr:MAG: hypothetical protein A3K64_03875 [Candidatus Micrarchaeota archaeon RBG_16_36_9]